VNTLRNDVRIMTIVYALAVILTFAIWILLGLSFDQLDAKWISLLAMLIAETAIYELGVRYVRSQEDAHMARYRSYMAVAVAYFVLVVAAIVVSFIFPLALWAYGLMHMILLAVQLMTAGLIALRVEQAREQERQLSERMQWVRQMGLEMVQIARELEQWNHPARDRLNRELASLQEKVRFSDPVSRPELAEEEFTILQQLQSLAGDVRRLVQLTGNEGDVDQIRKQLEKLANAIDRRNQQLLRLKSC